MAIKALFTAEDLEPIQAMKGRRYELVRGELFEVTTSHRHSEVVGQIVYLLVRWNRNARAGRVGADPGFTLERRPDTVLGPDSAFVTKGRLSEEAAKRGYAELAPDLAIEVRSPNDSWPELRRKADFYLAHGTREVWLVEPDSFVEVLRSDRGSQRLNHEDRLSSEDVLPGFECSVEELFPPQI